MTSGADGECCDVEDEFAALLVSVVVQPGQLSACAGLLQELQGRRWRDKGACVGDPGASQGRSILCRERSVVGVGWEDMEDLLNC
jgi:hypothetical protein